MALRDINTIQNPEELTYMLSYLSNNYMYESLANLGQRYSLKGDSVITKYFNICEIFNNKYTIEDKDNYVSKIKVINNKVYLQILEKNDLSNILDSEEIKYSINTAVKTELPLKLDIKINGIDYYKENSLLFIDGIYLYIATIGADNDEGIIELIIDKYNIENNTLIESFKIIDNNYYNDDNEKYIFMYYLYNIDDNYKFRVSKIKESFINTIYSDFNDFIISVYNSYIIGYYEEKQELNIEKIYNEVFESGFEKDNINDLDVAYNKDIEGFSILNDTYSYYDYNSILNYIYNQYVYLYPFMFEYYCDYSYKEDNNQLNKYILYKIFVKSFNESINDNISLYDSNFELYIPIDYSFNYYCNSNDSFYIYSNETPVTIYYTIYNINNDYVKRTNNFCKDFLFAHSDNYEQVKLYKYSIEYNSKNPSNINSINVAELYTPPFIKDNYWMINNQETKFKAIGEDAGNPNIIIVFTNDITTNNTTIYNINSEYKILSEINRDILEKLSWEKKTVSVDLFDGLNNIFDEEYNLNVLVPTIEFDNFYVNKFKNSLIINISDINNIISDNLENIKEYLGQHALITTFWSFNINDNNEQCKFVNIKNPLGETSLTLSELSNINSILNSQIEYAIETIDRNADKDKFNYLVFNNVNVSLKNNVNNYLSDKEISTNTIYPVLYNRNIYKAMDEYGVSNYTKLPNNNLILTFGFFNDIEENNESINYNKNDKFLPVTSGKIKLSNSEVTNNITEYVLSDLDIDNKYNYSYNYSFNTNIPTLDLKEVITDNLNVLNRTNILSLDKTGKVYYSYIGTSFDNNNKSIIHIGTSDININIGTTTMLNSKNLNGFYNTDGISIDFNNVEINTNKFTVYSNNTYEYSYNYIYDIDNSYLNISLNGNINEHIYYDYVENNETYTGYNINYSKITTNKPIKIYIENKITNLVALPITNIIDGRKINSNLIITDINDCQYVIINKEKINDLYFVKFNITHNDNNIFIDSNNKVVLPFKLIYQINN